LCCYLGVMTEKLPIAKFTFSQHLNELKNARLIKGSIDVPKVKYCIERDNCNKASFLFENLLKD
ncbi:MAG: transcriptional regulator, partial [Flavobacterium sp.]